MKKTALLFILSALMIAQLNAKDKTYTLVVEGYDWVPAVSLGAPMEYLRSKTTGWSSSQWLDYQLLVTAPELDLEWNKESRRIRPIVDQFQLDGVYEYELGKEMNYAFYNPHSSKAKTPLIIWLHGGGEGGHDPSVALMANRAANYASPEIQQIIEGAYVLVPQCPGAWMHSKQGEMTPGRDNDVYNVGLNAGIMKYEEDFAAVHDDFPVNLFLASGEDDHLTIGAKRFAEKFERLAGSYDAWLDAPLVEWNKIYPLSATSFISKGWPGTFEFGCDVSSPAETFEFRMGEDQIKARRQP